MPVNERKNWPTPSPALRAVSHYSYQLVFFAAGLFFWWRAALGFFSDPIHMVAASAGLGGLCWLQFTTSLLARRARLRRGKPPET
jgi:hypothetical protein